MVNARILDERLTKNMGGEILDSRVEGRVSIGDGSKIVGSVVRGPVIIGRNCVIENSYIAPYTSIGNDVEIIDSEIEYSVVMDGAVIRRVRRISESLIGRNAKITKDNVDTNTIKLHVSDYSEISL